ncbi:Cu(+)/Ag(+) sensor histidine kinase [Providencia sp. CRE-3FA-0001]|uniref:Sensor protein n=3 Tax=Enterobacterales TaxID=91347 RepID=A0AA42K3C6_9GAMM|nr:MULTISPECIES: Cu(+)/Ag(+) sensor histidine kinase [Providencia]EJD6410899.1 Cu(+)/Ag(+) sensor histidine kinase [Providencia rettgeri]EJD6500207.1 Cu(+)/Ag(+) sensor histidine kinase [Providencia rettgeri]EJD6644074.1 Cu(+)/Ag(+) sensor histidine kinase [Providencia rettgeri]EJD6663045.1 Cu(+)/Ag(+) sensor histidine kinase [Providencia rettgeri]ELL9155022.1 Cu(+)/Ag(+) sensor histidine kinase [Providencia rettgeri]
MNKLFRSPISISARLIFLISITLSLALLLFSWLMINSVILHFKQQDEYTLNQINLTIHSLLNENAGSQDEQYTLIRTIINEHQDIVVYLSDNNGKVLTSPNATTELISHLKNYDPSKSNKDLYLKNYRLSESYIQISGPSEAKKYRLVTALSLNFHHDYLNSLINNLIISAVLLCFLTVSIVYFLVIKGLKPLKDVSDEIKNVTSENLSIRLDPTAVPKELKQLTISFNQMLVKIEDVFVRQTNFSADIAHEMRTPITNLMTETQISLNKNRTKEELVEVLYSNLEEYNRLSRMISDMLFLAQADDNRLIPEKKQINLKEEITLILDYFEFLAEDNEIQLKLIGEANPIFADKNMLRRAITNLISNGIRYTPKGDSVSINLANVKGGIEIIISNPGKKIPEEHLPKLFDRFYRVDKSRQRKNEGSGIGLAIVKSIILAHKGSIQIASDEYSTRFTIFLPNNI